MNIFKKMFGDSTDAVIEKLEAQVVDLQSDLARLTTDKTENNTNFIKREHDLIVSKENAVAELNLTISRLKNDMSEMKADARDEFRTERDEMILNHSVALRELEDQLHDEYQKDINASEAEALAERKNAQTATGKYEGTLIVIQSLKEQLATANKLNETLVKQLPEIKANFTTAQGAQSVTVNK